MPPPPQLCTPCTHLFTRKKSHNLLGAITTTHTFQRSLLVTSTCPLCSELHWLVSKQQSRGLFRDLRRKDGDDVEVKFKYFESRDVGVGVRVTVDGVEEHHFRISVREDSPAAEFISTRTPYSDVSSSRTFDLLNKCIADCDANHPTCPKLSESLLPRRVLSLSASEPETVHLFCPSASARGKYIALSYCWGPDEGPSEQDPRPGQVKTTFANLASHIRGIVIKTLPQTIQDVLICARKVGVEYVWVDALCIVQDSARDRNEQMARMGAIYTDAYLTVSATSAVSCRDGFLADRVPEEYAYFTVPYRHRDGIVHSVHFSCLHRGKNSENLGALSEPLNTRGWAFQETLLSSRLVFFGSVQAYWRCGTLSKSGGAPSPAQYFERTGLITLSEEFGDPFPKSGQGTQSWQGQKRGISLQKWHAIVEDYTRREFSVQSDRMPAISGVAERYCGGRRKKEYLAGLWSSTLATDLLWIAYGYRTHSLVTDSSDLEEKPSYIPSWSWMSISGPIKYNLPHLQNEKLRPLFTRLSTQILNEPGAGIYGALQSATLSMNMTAVTVFVPRHQRAKQQAECFNRSWVYQHGKPGKGSGVEWSYERGLEGPSVEMAALIDNAPIRGSLFDTHRQDRFAPGVVFFDRDHNFEDAFSGNSEMGDAPSRWLCVLVAQAGESNIFLLDMSVMQGQTGGYPGPMHDYGMRVLGLIVVPENGWEAVLGENGSKQWENYTDAEVLRLENVKCRRVGLFIGSSNFKWNYKDVNITLV